VSLRENFKELKKASLMQKTAPAEKVLGGLIDKIERLENKLESLGRLVISQQERIDSLWSKEVSRGK